MCCPNNGEKNRVKRPRRNLVVARRSSNVCHAKFAAISVSNGVLIGYALGCVRFGTQLSRRGVATRLNERQYSDRQVHVISSVLTIVLLFCSRSNSSPAMILAYGVRNVQWRRKGPMFNLHGLQLKTGSWQRRLNFVLAASNISDMTAIESVAGSGKYLKDPGRGLWRHYLSYLCHTMRPPAIWLGARLSAWLGR
jgi:hypothetical protein